VPMDSRCNCDIMKTAPEVRQHQPEPDQDDASKERDMAEDDSTSTCPTCGAACTRSVHYLRDRRWPESYHVCPRGHAWITKAGER
jgi:hypothetical protein